MEPAHATVIPLRFTPTPGPDHECVNGSSNPGFLEDPVPRNQSPEENDQQYNGGFKPYCCTDQTSEGSTKKTPDDDPKIEMEDNPLIYKISEATPIHLTLFFAMQQALLSLSSSLAVSLLVADYACAEHDEDFKSRLLSSTLFMNGITTLLMVTIGVRLPLYQGATPDYVAPLVAMAAIDKDRCNMTTTCTGTNACYIEKLENVELWDGDYNEPKQVMINTEWGALGDDGCLDFVKTEYDRQVDKHSINPGRQIYEKMISGMYMGEIVRLALEKLRKHGLLFGGKGSEELSTRGRFYTKYVSEIESDVDDHFKNTKQVFEELALEKYSDEDCRIAQYVCSLVSTRAAFLASVGVAALLNKMDRQDVTVAVDGSLYRFHPHFHDLMVEKIQQLVKPGIKFKLMLSHDGSGKGAAIVTAVANRLRESGKESIGENGLEN
uniref:Phosphotransferase n=1 Tax=Magallana gigas TaxID=29159 RepID=K1RCD0_MAGGI